MIKIKKIEIEALENAGCNNGNFPSVEITFDNGKTYHDITCRCHRGCANTLCVENFNEGDEFQDYEAFLDYAWEGRY